MAPLKNDWLLTVARFILMAFIVVLGFAAIFVALAIPFIIVFQDKVMVEIAKQGVATGPEFIGALALLLGCVVLLMVLGIYFLVLLRRIVLSVGQGDPFVPANGDRLARMGWVALAGQVMSLPLAALAMWVAEVVKDKDKFSVGDDYGLDFSGLLLVLILFILARVFRQGARMREDLEGTV